MNSSRLISVLRWFAAGACLAGIVAFYRLLVHANLTTIALTFLLLILFLAARWGLRFAVVTSFAAGCLYNFFFLPPVGNFTVADPENLVALLAFLVTSVVASRLSHRMRAESLHAKARQAELEVLYSLSRGLLQTDEPARLANAIPATVLAATGCKSVLFYLLKDDRVYLSGLDWPTAASSFELKEIANAPGVFVGIGGEGLIPLRTGVRPIGALILRGARFSAQTLEAIGGLVAVSLDRARAAQSIASEEVAKEGDRFRALILHSVTQELRTPLTAIKESVGALRSRDTTAKARAELETIIEEEADRLNKIIDDTVELAQIDTQQTHMTLSPHGVQELIDGALQAASTALQDREVTVRLAPTLSEVMVDPRKMEKVIGHLLENAANYSEATEPIFISAEMEGTSVSCSVADRGIGIDDAEQALIFGGLYRGSNRSASGKGSGMGLAICRAIIEAHGGRLTVKSQLGQGSVFSFTVPGSVKSDEHRNAPV